MSIRSALWHGNVHFGPFNFSPFTFPPSSSSSATDPPIVTLRLGSTLSAEDIKDGEDVYFECHVQANPQWRKLYWLHDVSTKYHCLTDSPSLTSFSPPPNYDLRSSIWCLYNQGSGYSWATAINHRQSQFSRDMNDVFIAWMLFAFRRRRRHPHPH